MNRAQRRAALAQVKKINGFDITKGNLEVSIAGSDEKLVVDVMDFNVVDNIVQLYEKFSDMQKSYKEAYDAAFAEGDDKIEAKFNLMRVIIHDFSDAVEQIFGEGSCVKIFGHKYPQIVQISEFISDFKQVAVAIIENSGMAEQLDEAMQMAADTSNVVPMMAATGNVAPMA